MPRKKPTDAPTEPQADAADDAPAGPSEGAGTAKPTTKAQAMDAALAAGAVMPSDGVSYVKTHFGLEVSCKQFGTHKSLVRQKAEIDAQNKLPKTAKKPTTAVAKAPTVPAPAERATLAPIPSSAPSPAKPAASAADLARQVKALVAEHGAGAVGEMLDVFRE